MISVLRKSVLRRKCCESLRSLCFVSSEFRQHSREHDTFSFESLNITESTKYVYDDFLQPIGINGTVKHGGYSPKIARNTFERHAELFEQQIEYEEGQKMEAMQRAKKEYDNLLLMGRGTHVPHILRDIMSWYEPLAECINAEIQLVKSRAPAQDRTIYGPALLLLPAKKLSVLTINSIINGILARGNQGAPVAQLCRDIGEAVYYEVCLAKLKKEKVWLPQWQEEKMQKVNGSLRSMHTVGKTMRKYLDMSDWTNDIKIKVGSILLKLTIDIAKDAQNMPILTRVTRVEAKRLVGVVYMCPRMFDAMAKERETPYAEPRYLPMIVPPVHWENKSLRGGYYRLQAPFLRFRSKQQMRVLRSSSIGPVIESLNYLGDIPWKFNQTMLQVVNKLVDAGECIGELPSQEDLPIPTLESFIEEMTREQEAKAAAKAEEEEEVENEDAEKLEFLGKYAYKEKERRLKIKNANLHSLRCDINIKLNITKKFQDNTIYFPWNLDFRGRAYPIPPNLNHLGSDLCRGVLLFAESKPLGNNGLFWLKVHLCNLFGNNKISRTDRAKWVDDRLQEVFDSATYPITGRRWWTTAEEPFQALATCIEITAALQSGDPASYRTCLPVHQDGSCNGLQHYAALGRDEAGGFAVNLLPSNVPQDVYTQVLALVQKRVEEDCNIPEDVNDEKLKSQRRSALLVRGIVDRKVIKQTVMTSVYGVTRIGARQQIQNRLEEKLFTASQAPDKAQETEIFFAAIYLADVTLVSLGNMFSSAQSIMDWLAECSSMIAKKGHSMTWITPLGLPVMQPYRQARSYLVRTALQDVVLTKDSDSLPVSSQKQRSAFPPNFIHSLDATHMMMTSLKMKQRNLAFTAVHDSFWTHPADVEILHEELRNCFVELYQRNILEDLKRSLEKRYPDLDFPDIPARGTLDITKVKESDYFFH